MSIFPNKINLLLMPTDICNLNCIYCFHAPYHEKQGRMSLETLKKLYDITFKKYKDVTIIWHGGEPLIMGIDFYRKAIAMQKEYSNIRITNRMQSNLTLLSEEYIEFFSKNNISIGTSLDGCRNDELRGHTDKVLHNRNLMLQYNMTCGFIMVVSKKNIDNLIESYNFFKNINANFTLNFYVSTSSNNNDSLELDVDETVERIIELYNYWIADTSCNIHINYFERILNFIIKRHKSLCKHNSCLGKWMSIRYNGEITPCNRFFPDKYSYGNVWMYNDISEAFNSNGFKTILTEAIARRNKCRSCIIYDFCSGGCNNVAYNEGGINNNNGKSCEISRSIFLYIKSHIDKNIISRNNILYSNYSKYICK